MEQVHLHINCPSNEKSTGGMLEKAAIQGTLVSFNCIEYLRHITVRGDFSEHQEPFPEDAVLYAELLDQDGKAIRHCSSHKKNDQNLFVDYPELYYPDSYKKKDPDYQVLKDFGFPELLVKDLKDPYASLSDATIKCFYTDEKVFLFFCSATDKAHGALLDGSITYVDENGEPFDAIPVGDYTIHITLTEKGGKLLCEQSHKIKVVQNQNVMISRFDPTPHFFTMMQFAVDHQIFFSPDVLNGFIIPYYGAYLDGQYLGHLGVRTLIIQQDLPKYLAEEVFFFNYLMAKDSMSYSLEIPFLQQRDFFQTQEHFHVYYYEYGEPVLQGKKTPIRERQEEELMHLYRVDLVNEKAKENFFNLNEDALEKPILERGVISIPAGSTFAITGVVNPYARAKEEYTFHDESNTYTFSDDYKKIRYTFSYGETVEMEEREIGLVRYEEFPLGDSAYEFYNLFEAKPEMKGQTVHVHVEAYDAKDRKVPGAEKTVLLQIV